MSRPPLTSAQVVEKHRRFLFQNVLNYYKDPLVIERGQGSRVWDVEGREYLDFFGGILTLVVGHSHPRVLEAVAAQVRDLQHSSTLYPNRPIVDLAERLAGIAPGGLSKSYFVASGTEADETAILLAKLATGRQEIVALRHAYSGRGFMAMTLTAHAGWRQGGTHIAGVKHAHNAYCYRCAFGQEPKTCAMACARDLEELILTETSGQIAATIVEPIQGVGGFITPPDEYFPILYEITKKYGGLFISDEVQTGFGRTGRHWFGIEHWGVEPDIMTMAKGIANGLPLGACIAKPEIADTWNGLSISTFGGNPVSCAAALATIDVIEEEGLRENAARVGERFMGNLRRIASRFPMIGEVRGKGLMIGLELVSDPHAKTPAKEGTARFMEETKKRGLLVGRGGLYGNVVRIAPPLNVTAADVDRASEILEASFAAVA